MLAFLAKRVKFSLDSLCYALSLCSRCSLSLLNE